MKNIITKKSWHQNALKDDLLKSNKHFMNQ